MIKPILSGDTNATHRQKEKKVSCGHAVPTHDFLRLCRRPSADAYSKQNLFRKTGRTFCFVICSNMALTGVLPLVDNTKQRNRTTIYVSYIDMHKWKRNWALSVVVYKKNRVIMWISCLICWVSRRSSNEVCRHEKSNKNRKKRKTNMSRVCFKNVQATIVFACIDLQSLIQRRASLSEAAIERCHSSMYSGYDKNGARSPTLNTLQMLDLNKFKILYTLVQELQQVR